MAAMWTDIRYHVHLHTIFSDGFGTYREVLHAAARSGLHAVNITDHNILPQEVEGYYTVNGRRVLLLVGEEIHDRVYGGRGSGHLLALGVQRDVAPETDFVTPQTMIDRVRDAGGLAFIAHPIDVPVPYLNEREYSCRDWQVQGYHGIELWNAMTEFKRRMQPGPFALAFYLLFFPLIARRPLPETVRLWDDLLRQGRRVLVLTGSDAHAYRRRLGPVCLRIFAYERHFQTLNMHVLLDGPLTGDFHQDKARLLAALAAGHAYIGHDRLAPPEGFRFWATGPWGTAMMGDVRPLEGPVTLHATLPYKARVRLVHNGRVLHTWRWTNTLRWTVREPGAYRLEAFRFYWGHWRGWIYSNPIFLVDGRWSLVDG